MECASFILISGFLLVDKDEPNKVFFGKRISKIIIPTIFWSVFYSLLLMLQGYINGERYYDFDKVTLNWLSGKPMFHLWFMFMIPFLYLTKPILNVLLERFTQREYRNFCFIVLIATVSYDLFNYCLYTYGNYSTTTFFPLRFLNYLGYFSLGAYLKKYKCNFQVSTLCFVLFLSLLVTIFGSYFISYKYFYSYNSINTTIASIFLFLLAKDVLKSKFKITKIHNHTLGIYLVHPVFIIIIDRFLQEYLLFILNPFVYIPVVSLLVFLVSLVVSYLFSRNRILKRFV